MELEKKIDFSQLYSLFHGRVKSCHCGENHQKDEEELLINVNGKLDRGIFGACLNSALPFSSLTCSGILVNWGVGGDPNA